MESLIRWQPGETLTTLRQAIDKLLDETFAQPLETLTEDGDTLTSTTLYQTDRNYLIKTGLPGAEPEQIEVTVRSDQVSIRAEFTHERNTRLEGCTRLERTIERFFRTVTLPGRGDIEEAQAVLENNVLTVTVPKAPPPPSRKLTVEHGTGLGQE
ncbi:MAG TPA: Hsp20/alpha crystallin family protein [Ktedonobacterales bacterium]|jgi:HSP20 family protein